MTVISDVRRAAEHKADRAAAYGLYKRRVLSDREEICKWIVNALVRRYKAHQRRSGVRVGLMAWLNQNDSLQATYADAYSMDTRRRWARYQMDRLLDDTMRLFEDERSTRHEVAKLLEALLNAEHGEEDWTIRVSIQRLDDYSWKGKSRKGFYTLTFSHDRRPRESS